MSTGSSALLLGQTMAIDQERLELWFTSPRPLSPRQAEAIEEVRSAALELGTAIITNVPPCADQSDAVRKLRELFFVSADAIQRN